MKQFHKMILLFSTAWLLCLTGLIYLSLFHPILKENSSKYIKYRALKKRKGSESPFGEGLGVSKEIWISSEGKRVHCHVESPSSKIQFITRNESHSLLETLDNLKVWIRDDSIGEIKYFRSNEGVLDYAKQTLASEETFLASYKIANAKEAVFTCDFKDLTISFKEFPIAFSANGFSAHLQTEGSL
jgi:hypothetical protein